jgi:hypothetical protein
MKPSVAKPTVDEMVAMAAPYGLAHSLIDQVARLSYHFICK